MIADKLKQFSKSQEFMKQEGSFSLLLGYGFCALCLFGQKWYELYAKDYLFFLGIFDKANGIFVFIWEKYKETTDIVYRQMAKKGNKYIIQNLSLHEKHARQIDKLYAQNKPEQIKKLDKAELRGLIYEAIELNSILLRDNLFSEALDREMIKKYYDEASGQEKYFEKFFEMSSLLTFDSFKFRRDKILIKELKKKKIDYYSLQWIYTDYMHCKSLAKLKNMSKQIELDKLEKEVNDNDKVVLENIKKQKVYFEKLPENLKGLAYFIFVTMQLRDVRGDGFSKGLTVAYNAAFEYFSRIGLDPEDCVHSYYTDYLDNILENPDYVDLIKARKNGCAVIAEPGNPVKYTWEFGDYQALRHTFLDIVDESNKKKKSFAGVINGQVACRGKATGRVKIVLGKDDFDKFETNDILVTSMTRPEFVPLLKNAKAIITDEGGITCHAAIISRELKIPCIIGTRNASKILKDGDRVEVDADNGIVKVIKK